MTNLIIKPAFHYHSYTEILHFQDNKDSFTSKITRTPPNSLLFAHNHTFNLLRPPLTIYSFWRQSFHFFGFYLGLFCVCWRGGGGGGWRHRQLCRETFILYLIMLVLSSTFILFASIISSIICLSQSFLHSQFEASSFQDGIIIIIIPKKEIHSTTGQHEISPLVVVRS